MKRIQLCLLIALFTKSAFGQQRGIGMALFPDKKDSSSFEWTKYYDQKDSSFATTYLFSVKGMGKMSVLVVHTLGIEEVEYKWLYMGDGERYLANEGTHQASDFIQTSAKTLALKSDICDGCYEIELQFVSSKKESMKALFLRNMLNNMILKLDK